MLLCGRLGREQAGRFQVWRGWRGSQLRWLEEMPVHAGERGHRCQAGKVKPAGSNHLLLASLQPAPGMPLHRGSGFPGWEWQCFRGIADGTMGFPACCTPSPRSHPVAHTDLCKGGHSCAHRQLSNPACHCLAPLCAPPHLFHWQLALSSSYLLDKL